jgi:chromosome segregation ATPase
MDETSSKRQKINELLDYIDGRLSELEEEKEELKEYQEKDRERRCLEYALFERELEEVSGALEELEEERRGEVHGVNVRREAFNDREKKIQVSLLLLETHVSQHEIAESRRGNKANQAFNDDDLPSTPWALERAHQSNTNTYRARVCGARS